MSKKAGWNYKQAITRFFGTLGYFSCSMEWLWAVVLYFNYLQTIFLATSPDEKLIPIIHIAPKPAQTGSLTIVPIVIIVIIMIIVAIYSFIKMPAAMAKTSHKVTQVTAENLAPVIIKAQHKKLTKKARFKMTARLISIIKTLLVLIPIILTIVSRYTAKPPIDSGIAFIIILTLASFSTLFFVIQYVLAKLTQTDNI